MLGMAFDAAAGRDVERFLEGELDLAPGGEARLGARQAERVGVVVDAGVAILAGGVGHRLERPYVASLAVVLEGGMGERQFAAGPRSEAHPSELQSLMRISYDV